MGRQEPLTVSERPIIGRGAGYWLRLGNHLNAHLNAELARQASQFRTLESG